MWKRIGQALRSVVKTSRIEDGVSGGVISKNVNNAIMVGNSLDAAKLVQEKKSDALRTLNNTIKELSRGLSTTPLEEISMPIHSLATMWSPTSSSQLSATELEALGSAYFNGQSDNGIEKNIMNAIEIWKEASNKGNINSKYSLASCINYGIGCERNPKQCFKMMLELADTHQHAPANYAVGMMYSKGLGTNVDIQKAFTYIKAAAASGTIPEAVCDLANFYAYGLVVQKNESKAFMLYEAAAEAGVSEAQCMLAQMYYLGKNGQEVDYSKAFSLFAQASNAGHFASMFKLGDHYVNGLGVPVDFVKAKYWYEKAGNEGNIIPAKVNLASMYWRGIGVEKDLRKACEILEVSARSDPDSRNMLASIRAEIQELEGAVK